MKTIFTSSRTVDFSELLRKRAAAKHFGRAEDIRKVRRGRQIVIFANDFIGHEIAHFGVFEVEDLTFFMDLMKPLMSDFACQTMLDVGGNIGNHALYFSDYFEKVVSFEPEPKTFKLLQLNAAVANNVEVHNFGLGARSEKLKLAVDVDNPGLTKIASNEHISEAEVSIRALDDLDPAPASVGLIKIDVEGHEEHVIAGALKLIQRDQPIILLEQHVSKFVNGTTPALELLREIGYEFLWREDPKQYDYWLLRRLRDLVEVIRGRELAFLTGQAVPERNHTMLVALPAQTLTKLLDARKM